MGGHESNSSAIAEFPPGPGVGRESRGKGGYDLRFELVDGPFPARREPSDAEDLVKLVRIVDHHRLVIVIDDNLCVRLGKVIAPRVRNRVVAKFGRLEEKRRSPGRLAFSKSALKVRWRS